VLDCIASGAIWFDMEAIGVNVLINARQKGWSASPCPCARDAERMGMGKNRIDHKRQFRVRLAQVAADRET
jgi:aspartate aminotransferase-like enzyme